MTKIFLLPIETSVRELDYKLLLSLELLKKKGKVFIGSKGHFSIFMKYFKNFNYIDKGFHLNVSEKIYSSIKELGGEIFSLDEEGAVDFKNNASLSLRYSKGAFEHSKRVYFWGEKQRNIYSKDNTKSLVTGHPRFELLGSELKNIYFDEKNKIISRYGNFVLVNTNMSFGNNIRGDMFVEGNYIKRFPEIKKLIIQDKYKIKEICKVITKLLNNNYKVVLRPHPEEDLKFYEEFFQEHDNLFITNEGNVIPWIMASQFLIHTDCTTSIESLWLKKHCISILPRYIDHNYICPLPVELSMTSNIDNLMHDISQLSGDSYIDNKKLSILEDHFSFSKKSLKIITEDLISNGKSNGKIQLFDMFMHAIKFKLTSLKTSEDKLISSKLRGFNKKCITDKLKMMIDLQNTKESISVVKITKYLYEIKTNN